MAFRQAPALLVSLLVSLVLVTASAANPEGRQAMDVLAPDFDQEPRPGSANDVLAIDFVGSIDGKSFYAQDTRMNVASCLDFCHLNGMHMATITSAAQNALISDFLTNGGYTRIAFFYLAGWDLFGEGDFKWIRTGQSWTYSRWASGHPQVGDRAWNCVAVNKNGGWQNQVCSDSEPHRYIIGPLCELP